MNKQELDALLNDAISFIERLWIARKDGRLVRLKLNTEQREILSWLIQGYSVIIVKSRQIGSSTLCRAYQFWKAYTSRDPIRCACLAHKRDSFEEMAAKDQLYYDTLPKLLRKKLSKRNTSMMRFKDSKATLSAHTAGGKGGTRSFTFTNLHITELCMFDDAEAVVANAIASANENQVIIESTARQFGDPVHRLVQRADRGEMPGNWKTLFFPWFEHEEYKTQLPEGTQFIPTSSELELINKYGVTYEQLNWRRNKIGAIGAYEFQKEYPSCLEDIFSQQGNAYYSDDDLQYIKVYEAGGREWFRRAEYNPNDRYALGADVSGGIGRDYSTICVLSKLTNKPVYIYRSNKISPASFASKILSVATEYQAKVLVESNNHGGIVLNELRHLGFTNLWKDQNNNDWLTTSTSKLKLHTDLKEAIKEGVITELDFVTYSEIKELESNKDGLAPASVNGEHGHSDNVIALGLSWQCLKLISLPTLTNPVRELNLASIRRNNNPFNRHPSLNRSY